MSTFGRSLAVLVALSVLALALVLGVAGLVLATRWLWLTYRDLAVAASLLGPVALGASILVSVARRVLATGDDRVSEETLRRLREGDQ